MAGLCRVRPADRRGETVSWVELDGDDIAIAARFPVNVSRIDPNSQNQPDSDSDCSPDGGRPSDQPPMGSMSGKS
jgi:hypothetical protein